MKTQENTKKKEVMPKFFSPVNFPEDNKSLEKKEVIDVSNYSSEVITNIQLCYDEILSNRETLFAGITFMTATLL